MTKKKTPRKATSTAADDVQSADSRIRRTANLFMYGAIGAAIASVLSFSSYMRVTQPFDLPDAIFYGALGLILFICSSFITDRNRIVIYILGGLIVATIGYILFFTRGSTGGIGVVFVLGLLTYMTTNLIRDGLFEKPS